MELRDALKPPQRVDQQEMKEIVLQLQYEIYAKNDCSELLQQLNEKVVWGVKVTEEMIENYWRWESLDEFVRRMSTQMPKPVTDITKEETLEILNIIFANPAGEDTEYYANLLEYTFPNCNVWNLIFNPETLGYTLGENEPSPEEIVEIVYRNRQENS